MRAPKPSDPPGGARLDNRRYYDEFAAWYERERGRPYHALIDDLEIDAVARYGRGRRVLEAGCGTGLLLSRIQDFSAYAAGVDLSAGMLERARARGLDVTQGSITALPHPSASFDVTCAFKVLAHVPDVRAALSEMARVTAPGGVVLAEFYNPRSLRYLAKALGPPRPISERETEGAVYTRYDAPRAIRRALPGALRLEALRGVRILTPFAGAHRVPGLGSALARAERALADVPGARALGGFVIAIARKRPHSP